MTTNQDNMKKPSELFEGENSSLRRSFESATNQDEVREETKNKFYICRSCGFSENNRPNWCDLGCGSDYNEMIEVKKLDIFLATLLAKKREECGKLRPKFLWDDDPVKHNENLIREETLLQVLSILS